MFQIRKQKVVRWKSWSIKFDWKIKIRFHMLKNSLSSLVSKWRINRLVRIYAEVVTSVAGGLEAEGLPGYPKSLFIEINEMKSLTKQFSRKMFTC
jgi:hypothetical protein